MKKLFWLLAAVLLPLPALMAGPGGCGGCGGGGCRPCPPPPPHHHGGHGCGHGSSGVRLAADIVGLVGVSLGTARVLATPPVQSVVVQQPAAVQQPVIVQQPVAVQPEKPQPRTVTIMPDGTRIEKY